MSRGRVNLQLLKLLAPQAVLRQHAAHGSPDHAVREALKLVTQRDAGEAAGITRVAIVLLGFHLVASHADLVGVDDDHEVANIHVRAEDRLVLSAQQHRDLRGETPQGLILSIYHIPLALDVRRLRGIGLDSHLVAYSSGRLPALSMSHASGKGRAPGRLGSARCRPLRETLSGSVLVSARPFRRERVRLQFFEPCDTETRLLQSRTAQRSSPVPAAPRARSLTGR